MTMKDTYRQNRATFAVGGVLLLGMVALLWWLHAGSVGEGALVARVHASDGQVYELPLAEDAELAVETDLGRNVIVVEGGAAHVAEADCPHGDCLRQAAISEPGQQLICLPHELWVEIVAEGAESGELNVNAVTDGVDLVSR